MIKDRAAGLENIGASATTALKEQSSHSTFWQIDRYDADVHERHVRRIKAKIEEMLVLANHHFARGDHKSWFKYVTEAEILKTAARSYAYNSSQIEKNDLLNEGINEAWLLILGAGGTAFNNANSQLGVGDDATAAAPTQTDLVAVANKLFKAMNGGFPTSGTQKATWQSDFTSAEANFAWNEFSVRNGATANKNLNRKVSTQGTKASGQTWTLSLGITLL